jgi:hypothetical protein
VGLKATKKSGVNVIFLMAVLKNQHLVHEPLSGIFNMKTNLVEENHLLDRN